MDTDGIINSAIEIFKPVLESATVLAAHYAKACGRDIVLAQDMHMGMMYAARYVTGKKLGSLFPEVYEDPSGTDSDSDSGSWETASDEELIWGRYEGQDDQTAKDMNVCADSWNAWEPENPAERALKNAVDKMNKN
jgi:hypothetical protein